MTEEEVQGHPTTTQNEDDPILEEFKFCGECEPKVHMLIEYIRNLENAQVVAKEALEGMEMANRKLTVEQHRLADERDKWKDRAEKVSQMDLEKKMKELRDAEQRLVNRSKLV